MCSRMLLSDSLSKLCSSRIALSQLDCNPGQGVRASVEVDYHYEHNPRALSYMHCRRLFSTSSRVSSSKDFFSRPPYANPHLCRHAPSNISSSSVGSERYAGRWQDDPATGGRWQDHCATGGGSVNAVTRTLESDVKGEGIKILVIGGGGREHAICYGLQRSLTCSAVFCAPGNPGIAAAGDAVCMPDLDISTSSCVSSFCREHDVGLVVVGPEAPLVAGLVDDLQAAGIVAFGPSAKAAALEGSKDFMKRLCMKYNIPTAKYKSFNNAKDAKNYVSEIGTPIVVKADGLAAGKGVIIAMTLQEAFDAVDSMLVDKAFGAAGGLVIVEEFLEGEEVSFFALVDGENALPLASAQDHKRVGDGDTGPNTGGMGAYSPAPALTPQLEALVMDSIIHPTVKGMKKEGCKFVGVLYAGLIIENKSGVPKLLEYNVRFGDPECQVLIPRLQSDLASTLLAACTGQLESLSLSWSNEVALVVVLASEGYPGKYKKGTLIKNLVKAEAAAPEVKIFHAGTALDSQGNVVATGGRVLGVTALGKDIVQAQERAYCAVDRVDWPDGYYRRDIGWRAIAHLQECHKAKV